ncbi:MAG: adenylate kinase [Solobacterium sp.]|nr:adenylate kinase [Solobacterium sp.]MCH4047936.1 adenylate kinase [Solobacterium sp.]MCH4075478.1 adenylate kinase [Solobacterium sp.]MCI1313645.1 adenylate kinase [Solobacterium sp.]MCI1346214.1 adenylate kinase [Solobacterium sp.]
MRREITFQKAIVIGCPGAGKSTFARKLRDQSSLPIYYLDMIWHQPDRTALSREIFDRKVDEILGREEWIIDGCYVSTLEKRMAACEAVFLLDYPIEMCLDGASKRIGKKREDMPWVEEEMDEEFRQWIVDFPKRDRPVILALLQKYSTKENHIFQERAEADRYLKEAYRNS